MTELHGGINRYILIQHKSETKIKKKDSAAPGELITNQRWQDSAAPGELITNQK